MHHCDWWRGHSDETQACSGIEDEVEPCVGLDRVEKRELRDPARDDGLVASIALTGEARVRGPLLAEQHCDCARREFHKSAVRCKKFDFNWATGVADKRLACHQLQRLKRRVRESGLLPHAFLIATSATTHTSNKLEMMFSSFKIKT